MNRFLLLAALLFGPLAAHGQVFDDGVLPTVRISIDPADLDQILEPGNEESDQEFSATFSWESPGLNATVDSVGFRLRGNTSRYAQKKSFKVSFNTFRQGGRWEGLEKLNLNGEHNDPSIMRSKLAWDLFADMGVPASRANHVRLYINGEYRGLYMNVEHVDEVFLQRYFGDNEGNLYKALWPADLTYLGPSGDDYRPQGPDRRPYDLTQGASDEEGYDDLARFVSILNTSSDAAFPASIERVFNVRGFLRALAVTVATGSWDTYWYLKNNFYLYHHRVDGRWHYVPFDMDNSFGIWWEGIQAGLDWSDRNVYRWGHPTEPRPLAERILAVPRFRQQYTLYLRELLGEHFTPARLEVEVNRLTTLTQEAALDDGFRTLDYGYTAEDYHNSFTEPLGGHVTAGLLPFVSQRHASALGQLDAGPIAPVVSDVRLSPDNPRPTDAVRVSAVVESESGLQSAVVRYWPDRPEAFTVPLRPEDGRMVASVPPLGASGTIDLRIEVTDSRGLTRQTDLLRVGIDGSRPLLYINELMADNESTIQDEHGDFDDWAELFNGMDIPLHLGGMTLSDDPLNPGQWALPDMMIPEGGHLLLWLDGEEAEGPLHAPFRLSRDGETLALYDAQGEQLDFVAFGPQEPDMAWARTADGAPQFTASAVPTPGAPNPVVDAVEPPPGAPSPAAYPNPFSTVLSVTGGPFEVFDTLGRRVHTSDAGRDSWDATGMPAGLYFVRSLESGTTALPVIKLR